ncbi:MAG: hypothetical protein RRY97_06405, partial [Oscillibacter sp.]
TKGCSAERFAAQPPKAALGAKITQEGFLSFFNHPFLKLLTGFKNLPQLVEKAFSTSCGDCRKFCGSPLIFAGFSGPFAFLPISRALCILGKKAEFPV